VKGLNREGRKESVFARKAAKNGFQKALFAIFVVTSSEQRSPL
jgi:hypothetical protein